MQTANHFHVHPDLSQSARQTSRSPSKPHGKIRLLAAGMSVAAILSLPLTTAAAGGTSAAAQADEVSFLQAPEGAQRMTIPLALVPVEGGRPASYLAHRSPQPLTEAASLPASVADVYKGKEFSAFEIAALPDGTHYLAVLSQDNKIKFLNQSQSRFWFARVYRIPSGSGTRPELVRKGFQSFGNDVTIPIKLQLPGIGTNHVQSFKTQIGYSLNGEMNGRPQVYSGRGPSPQVTGSQMVAGGKLTLTVTVPDDLKVTPDTQVSLNFDPLDPGLPNRTGSGKITDFLTLGSARLVVTALAPDFSSATLAVVKGSLEQSLKQQLHIGAKMPPFSQVDLVSRKTVTREDVLGEAKHAPGIIFIFGDLAPQAGRFGRPPYGPYSRSSGNRLLPLPPGDVVEQAGVALQPKPIVVLVTRQISMNFLYDRLRDRSPGYLILSDFVNPLQTTFRLPHNTSGPWYGSRSAAHGPTLRQLFNLPANTLSIVAFNPTGKVRYVNTDAATRFLSALAEARSALADPDRSKQ